MTAGNDDAYERLTRAHREFTELRNAAYALADPRGPGESTVQFHLRLARFLEPHRWTGDEVDVAFNRARQAGRALVKRFNEIFAMIDDDNPFIATTYAEAFNVFVFTAPLDAQNWKKMQEPRHSEVDFASWAQVAAINSEAMDIHIPFMAHIRHIRARVASGALARDPLPTADVEEIVRDMYDGQIPASLAAQTVFVRGDDADAPMPALSE